MDFQPRFYYSLECMWFECNEAYRVLRQGGMMIFDDMTWHQAFHNFAQDKDKKIIYIGKDLGFIIK